MAWVVIGNMMLRRGLDGVECVICRNRIILSDHAHYNYRTPKIKMLSNSPAIMLHRRSRCFSSSLDSSRKPIDCRCQLTFFECAIDFIFNPRSSSCVFTSILGGGTGLSGSKSSYSILAGVIVVFCSDIVNSISSRRRSLHKHQQYEQ